jgi:hypothetical protein
VVELNIGIRPMGIVFENGQGLRLNVSGRDMRLLPELDNPHVANMEPVFTKGTQAFNLDGKYAECYLIPKV